MPVQEAATESNKEFDRETLPECNCTSQQPFHTGSWSLHYLTLLLVLCRKQLLNKCQEEFEKGAAAMEAVEAREKANEGKSKEELDKDQAEVHMLCLLCLLSCRPLCEWTDLNRGKVTQ